MDSLDAEDVKFDILEVSLRDIVSFVMLILVLVLVLVLVSVEVAVVVLVLMVVFFNVGKKQMKW
jgi:hypothetical protein